MIPPQIKNVSEKNDKLHFTLSDLNVSIANGLRRTIISDISTVVFKTTPYEESRASIAINTTRFNNEILKQRLSCIPIHITDMEMPLENYIMEMDIENTTDTIMHVTTEDFKIKNVITNEYLSEKDTQSIFPPNPMTNYFIDFVRLRPKVSNDIIGEKIKMTCEFTLATPKEDAMFNVVSTCSYGFTQDIGGVEEQLRKKVLEWKGDDMSKQEIDFQSKNWRLLDAQRIVVRDSFDFTIETVGVFTNKELVGKGCDAIIRKLDAIGTLIDTDKLEIIPSENTMNNSYDIILVDEDYTIGKVIEYFMYSKYYDGLKTLSFCGFKKMHPHDSDSIIRLAYRKEENKSNIKNNLKDCIIDAIKVYNQIHAKI